jgi:hypothetical protein
MNTSITLMNVIQGDIGFGTTGAVWNTTISTMLEQFIGEQIDLSELFSDEGAVPAGQYGVQSINVTGDLDEFDPLNSHTLSRGTTDFSSIRMTTADYGKEYVVNKRAIERMVSNLGSQVIEKIMRHIAHRTIFRKNNLILDAIDSGILSANATTEAFGMNMFYNFAERVEANEIPSGNYMLLCSVKTRQRLNDLDLFQNIDTNGGNQRDPAVLGTVGSSELGFGIDIVNCGVTLRQKFNNSNTILFVRREDIGYITEQGAEGLRVWTNYVDMNPKHEALEVTPKLSFGAGINADGIAANMAALKNRNIFKVTLT